MADLDKYNELVKKLYDENPPIELPPEYAWFMKDNILRILLRLSRYKFVTKMLRKSDRVLEIGCGSGMGSIFLSQHCESVLGIDLKQHEIDEARKMNRRQNVAFEVADFYELSLKEKFDVILMQDVIEHFDEENGKKFIAQTLKCIKPNGMFIIGTPSIHSYQYQGELSRAGHIKCYDQEELINILDEYYGRILPFSMNDEVLHTGFSKMSWYYFMICTCPKFI